jgi:hypothetical protein
MPRAATSHLYRQGVASLRGSGGFTIDFKDISAAPLDPVVPYKKSRQSIYKKAQERTEWLAPLLAVNLREARISQFIDLNDLMKGAQ